MTAPGDISEERFLQIVSAICSEDALLTPVGAALVAAHHLGIAKDSRSFSRQFDISHALVLREVSELTSEDHEMLAIVSRNDRTQRVELALTERAEQLLSRLSAVTESGVSRQDGRAVPHV
jgi:hypothetical protein